MVTLPGAARLPLLRKSLAAYAAQSHSDRELIVVLDSRGSAEERAAVLREVEEIGQRVTIVTPDDAPSLGALRNLSVQHASGDILCQWDDDDLQHPDRLGIQYRALCESGCAASYLREVMMLRLAGHRLFWTNWAATPAGAHPATMMCQATAMRAYPEDGPLSRLSEDVALLETLEREGPVHRLANLAHLYIYVTHRTNTAPQAHHEMLERTLGISRGLLLRRESSLRQGLASIPFDESVSVEGSNGFAFSLTNQDPVAQ
jgi:glycosyltransferase involved in cell wall biosynthesis